MSLAKSLAIVLAAGVGLACGSGNVESAAPPQGTAEAAPPAPATAASPVAVVQRVNPILAVESIEPSVAFWEALGFTVTNQNVVDGAMQFAEIVKDGFTIHYQTLSLIETRTPDAAASLRGSSAMVYVTVDQLDGIVDRLGNAEVVIPRRQTSWGADEIYVREPGGHIIGFAAFGN